MFQWWPLESEIAPRWRCAPFLTMSKRTFAARRLFTWAGSAPDSSGKWVSISVLHRLITWISCWNSIRGFCLHTQVTSHRVLTEAEWQTLSTQRSSGGHLSPRGSARTDLFIWLILPQTLTAAQRKYEFSAIICHNLPDINTVPNCSHNKTMPVTENRFSGHPFQSRHVFWYTI
jgi:hypothetical protein